LESAQSKRAESGKGAANEVAALRRERDDLHAKLSAEIQAAAESKRCAKDAESQLNLSAAEMERLNAELQQQRAEFEQTESKWRKQLEAAQSKKAESSKGVANEAAALRRERDDLHAKLSVEIQAAAESKRLAKDAESRLNLSAADVERLNAELHQQRAEFEETESKWRKQSEAAQSKKAESGKGVVNEAAALRRERDDLHAKLSAEIQAAAESRRRAKDAESQLTQRAAELERANTELQLQRTKLEHSETKWRKQMESAQSKKTDISKVSADEVAALRREREELHAKLTAELHAVAQSSRRAEDAEGRLTGSEAELEHLNAELKLQAANLEHSEAKWRKQSEAAQAQKLESQKILAAADDCNRRLEKELAELRLKLDKAAGKSRSEPPPAAKPVQRAAPVEPRPAPQPARIERGHAEPQDAPWQYPAQLQEYQFDCPRSQPTRRTREPREPRETARRRRQP
jgi:chromosome segregation ATPase